MLTLKEIRVKQHHKVLDMRSIERMINNIGFEIIFSIAESKEKDEILLHIQNGDKGLIEEWISKQNQKQISQMSLRELRQYARKVGIPYYARLPKSSLLSEINSYGRSQEEARTRIAGTCKTLS